MPVVNIPDLRRKFALLRRYPTPRTWPELAAAFGRPHKTLQYWQDGKADLRLPCRMPDWAVPILSELIANALAGVRSDDEVRQFVFGPAALFEEEVLTGAGGSMMKLIAREAQEATSSLIRRPDGIELVEVETYAAVTRPRIWLGEWFRIAVRRRRQDNYVLALQHTQAAWAPLPAGVASEAPQTVLIPGLHAQGDPAYMREQRDRGRHLFVCLETPDPPPAHVTAHWREETILDRRSLDALAGFYETQAEDRRACHLLDVEITAEAE